VLQKVFSSNYGTLQAELRKSARRKYTELLMTMNSLRERVSLLKTSLEWDSGGSCRLNIKRRSELNGNRKGNDNRDAMQEWGGEEEHSFLDSQLTETSRLACLRFSKS
jgi:hypothetical protein